MNERGQRFDDTFWGQVFRFWPLMMVMIATGIFIYNKLEAHETRLVVVELQLAEVKTNLDEVRGDVKILLRRP